MKLEISQTIPYPALRVFEALRDRIEELAALMENVESVEILEQTREPPLVHQRNRWQGVKESLPALFRPFVSRETVAWFDNAEWNQDTLSCSWRIEPIKLKGFFDCSGTTTMQDVDGGCRLTLRGDAILRLERVPGLPAMLARRIHGPVERFVFKQLEPNFVATVEGLGRFLDQD